MDRYTVYALIASASLSFYAYVAANNRPKIQYIEFDEPIVINARLEN
jgi:hypothetical protein